MNRFTSDFTIKIQSPVCETSHLYNDLHYGGRILNGHGELISIPSQCGITGIGINTTQHLILCRQYNIMFHGVSRQCRMIWFNIQLKMIL